MWKKVLVSFLAISTVTGFNLDDFDDNKDGKIQYHEFLKLSESENGQQIKANGTFLFYNKYFLPKFFFIVNKYFNNYDINKDGTLSVDELVYLTSSLPQKHENHIQKFFNVCLE